MTVAMRFALKIAYDGTRFSGSQRQPKIRTVDGECIFVLKKIGAIAAPAESRYQSASRTDRGVSAAGNVIAFDTQIPKKALLGSFNSAARDVWAWALTTVPDHFNARRAVQRWYRYHLPGELDIDRARSVSDAFRGRHDFKRFAKIKTGAIRTLDSLEVSKAGTFLLLDIKGQSFLWSMIRRIASAVELFCRKKISMKEIDAALAGANLDLGLAPPEPLILMDVMYDFDFEVLPNVKVRKEVFGNLHRSQLEATRWMTIAGAIGNEHV